MEKKIKMEKQIVKPFAYEPKYNKRFIKIQCPFRFFMESQGFSAVCIKEKCALWLPIQRACSLQVIARGHKIE